MNLFQQVLEELPEHHIIWNIIGSNRTMVETQNAFAIPPTFQIVEAGNYITPSNHLFRRALYYIPLYCNCTVVVYCHNILPVYMVTIEQPILISEHPPAYIRNTSGALIMSATVVAARTL